MTSQPALFGPAPTTPTTTPEQPYTWAKPWGWRPARLARCRQCRAQVLRGHNDDWCAFEVDADPTPLTALGEVHALLTGIRTLTARRNQTRLLLTRRDRSAIVTFPAGGHRPGNRWDVIPEHHCHTTWPTAAVTASVIAPPPPIELEECPF